MNNVEFPEDSESSDEDYIPEGPKELPSEEESDGIQEDPLTDNEDSDGKGRKRKKKGSNKRRKQQKVEEEVEEKEEEAKPELTEEEKKKRADSLWASFKMDTGFKSKKTENEATSEEKKDSPKVEIPKTTRPVQEKVKITQVFEFAGEEVEVEKEVAVDSIEARLFKEKPSGSDVPKKVVGRATTGGLKGIGSVLSKIGKKPKVSTLEKSKLDWDKFKKEENIEEELKNYNKGKDGYLDRQDFLQRADLRRFEIEKEVRTIERNKRMNNV